MISPIPVQGGTRGQAGKEWRILQALASAHGPQWALVSWQLVFDSGAGVSSE